MTGKILLLFFILNISIVNAAKVKVSVNPTTPVINESFELNIKISDSNFTEIPYISFDPGKINVLDKINNGVESRTVISNGNFSTNKSISFTYKLMSKASGTIRLKNFKIAIGNDVVYKRNQFSIQISTTRKKNKDLYLAAEPSKNEIFLGEGVVVDYVIYSKYQIDKYDYLKFPKFKNWIKRYGKLLTEEKIVRQNGVVFKKIKIYSAKLFPVKNGSFYVDNISLKVAIPKYGNNFFSFGNNRYSTKTIKSKRFKINVKEIPVTNIPDNYTGLVGNFDVSYKINKTKFLKNEVIELKLKIKGDGQLETYKPPKIIKSSLVEEFDKQASIDSSESSTAKTVVYTYLCRDSGVVDKHSLSFSFFDPKTLKMYTKSITIPKIIIANSTQSVLSNTNNVIKKDVKKYSRVLLHELAPNFSADGNFISLVYKKLKYFLIFILILLIIPFSKIKSFLKSDTDKLFVKFLNYNSFKTLIYHYSNNKNPIESIIAKSLIPHSEKKFLLELYEKCISEYNSDTIKSSKIRYSKNKLKSILEKLNTVK